MRADPAVRLHAGARERLRLSEHLNWFGFGAELVGISAGTHRVPAMSEHRIGVHVGTPVTAHCHCNRHRMSRVQSHGDTDVVPAGIDGQWSGRCRLRDPAYRLNGRLRATHAVVARPRVSCRAFNARYALSTSRMGALRAELEASHVSDALHAESLCVAMIVRLADAEATFDTKSSRPMLPRHTAMCVIDYIDAHLDTRLTLAELADVAGLSVPHFKGAVQSNLRRASPSPCRGKAHRTRENAAFAGPFADRPDRARLRLCACEPHGALDQTHARRYAEGDRRRHADRWMRAPLSDR